MPLAKAFDPEPELFDAATPTTSILKTYLALREQRASRNDRDLERLWEELLTRIIQRDIWAAQRTRDARPPEMTPAYENIRLIRAGMSDDWKADVLIDDSFISKYLGLAEGPSDNSPRDSGGR